jgi:inorganic pyrophosphatase
MNLPSTFANKGKHIHAVIETPKGSAAKYNFDRETGMFKLKKILPEGMAFPLHFGFIPNTLAGDGDPVDVMVLMDEPSWPGCFIECKLLGVIEAEQEEEGTTKRNDRVIASAIESNRYKEMRTIFALDNYLIDEIINFLVTYNSFEKKEFKVIGRQGPHIAIKLVRDQITA